MSAQKTILVVEDEAELSMVLRIKLTGEGFNVVIAQDALEATAAVRRNNPDLIIMDFSMPAGSGADVYKRLYAALDGASVPPVIFLSALPVERVKESVPPSDNVQFMTKPADFDLLSRTIRSMLKLPAPAVDGAKKDNPKVDLDLDAG